MARRDLVDMYCIPEDYAPPLDKDFRGNTMYPNLNSEEYRRRIQLTPTQGCQFANSEDGKANVLEFNEFILSNEKKQILLVANDYRRRLWSGSFYLFPDVSSAQTKTNLLAEHPCQSPISSVCFQSDDKVLFGTATGSLELWEILQVGKSDTLGVYKIDSKPAHLDILSKVTMFEKNRTKFVTASSDGDLKLWDLDNRAMMSTSTYHGAHSYAITDLSAHSEEELFVSVSRDKSALIWDHRQVLPATGILSNHPYHLTCCNWHGNAGDNSNVIVVGDAKGDVFQLDRRAPEKILSPAVSVFDRPVRKMERSTGEDRAWIICGNSRELKRSADLKEVPETIFTAVDWIRDFLVKDDGQLVVIGQQSGVHEVKME